MSIAEVCNREVYFVSRDEAVSEVVRIMRRHHVGDVVVVEQRAGMNVPVGMVTDRDIVLEIVAAGVDPDKVTAGDVMGQALWTIGVEQDLFMAMNLMRDKGVRRLPVVNTQGGLEGLMTVDDVLELVAELLGDISQLINVEQTRERQRRT